MSELNSKTEIIRPTPSSLAFCFIVLLLVFLAVVLPRLGGDTLLQLFLGDEAGQSLITASRADLGSTFELVFSSDLMGRAVVFGVWMFIGLAVYILGSLLIGTLGRLEEEADELEYVHQNKRKLLLSDLETLGFRIGVAAIWAVFMVLCIRFVFSFLAFAGYSALIENTSSDWVNFLLGSALLLVAMHLHVIFARLVGGRTRLWQPAP